VVSGVLTTKRQSKKYLHMRAENLWVSYCYNCCKFILDLKEIFSSPGVDLPGKYQYCVEQNYLADKWFLEF